MLIIEGDSVYEVDEKCLESRKIPQECGIYEAIERMNNIERVKKEER
jgi:hypothetical protein